METTLRLIWEVRQFETSGSNKINECDYYIIVICRFSVLEHSSFEYFAQVSYYTRFNIFISLSQTPVEKPCMINNSQNSKDSQQQI